MSGVIRYYEVPGDNWYTIEDHAIYSEPHGYNVMMRFQMRRAAESIGWASTIGGAEAQIINHIKEREVARKEAACAVISQTTNNIWQLERGMAPFRETKGMLYLGSIALEKEIP